VRINEERYRALFNSSSDAIFVRTLTNADTPTPFIEVNEAACRWLGYSREQLLQMSPRELDSQDVGPRLAAVNKRLRAGERVMFETVMRSGEGRLIPIEVSSQAFTLGGRMFGLEVMRDLTERKRAEEEVLRLSLVVEQSPTPVVMTDTDANIIYVNPAFEHVTGYTQAEVKGRNPRILQSGVHPKTYYKDMWDTLLAGDVWRGEFCNKKKNGEIYWESAAIAQVRNAAGEVHHYVGIKEDITRTKQIEDELRQAKTAAEAANQAKSTFLANMSHEIRTPLNAILGYAQLLRRDATLPGPAKEKLNTINRSGEHLLELINDILEMAKIEAGRISIEPVPFDLHLLLEDLLSMFRIRSDAKGLELRLARDESLPQYVVADIGRIRQILINLCGNAVKFTDIGHIELRGSMQTDHAGQQILIMEIEDTGIGISPTDLTKLFGHFEQSQSGRKQQTGTGLGLAISREYARLMGGDITVTSHEGQGSVFRIEIPIRVSNATHVAKRTSVRHVIGLEPNQAPVRILVVDDDQSNRDWLVTLLRNIDFEVREAGGGAEAVSVWDEWKPQLVLMDLRMPGMDGYEATRKIKARPGGKDTVIIALTASTLGGDYPHALKAGVREVMGKPFNINELFDKMAKHLGLRFRYEDTVPVPATESPTTFDPRRLADLPETLTAGLFAAVASGDPRRIEILLDNVAGFDEKAAEFLRDLADQYDYDRLTHLLKKDAT
jgi:PAS domain S-box-containing protein